MCRLRSRTAEPTPGVVTVAQTLGRHELTVTMYPPADGAGPMPVRIVAQGGALDGPMSLRAVPADGPGAASPTSRTVIAQGTGSTSSGMQRDLSARCVRDRAHRAFGQRRPHPALGSRRPTDQLLEVERGRRDMKQILDLRPAYPRLEDRIRAHVLLCWPALLMVRIVETRATTPDGQATPPSDEARRLHTALDLPLCPSRSRLWRCGGKAARTGPRLGDPIGWRAA